jgi:hypothetical protein
MTDRPGLPPVTSAVTSADAAAAAAARALAEAEAALPHAPAYQALEPDSRADLRDRLNRVRAALLASPQALASPADPYDTDVFATAMAAPLLVQGGQARSQSPGEAPAAGPPVAPKSMLRTVNDLPSAAGNMVEELDFASFVASLVHGTFDAIVDSSIRQMEAFSALVSSLSQTVEDFSRDNVSTNQVRDWLVERHPADLQLVMPRAAGQSPRILPRTGDDDDSQSPEWLSDYGLGGEGLSEELIETRLIPVARQRLGEERMRSLASMALMGLHKVRVERGEISARIRIRAKASDATRLDYAQSQDPASQGSWSGRAGFSAPAAQAMISTAVNAQSDAAIAAELQGEVRIVFVSETVPLEAFVSDAQRVLLERAARTPVTPARPSTVPQTAAGGSLPPPPTVSPAVGVPGGAA